MNSERRPPGEKRPEAYQGERTFIESDPPRGIGLEPTKIAYTVREAVVATGIGRSKMHEFISAGIVKARKAGGKTLIRAVDLREFIDGLPEVETRQ